MLLTSPNLIVDVNVIKKILFDFMLGCSAFILKSMRKLWVAGLCFYVKVLILHRVIEFASAFHDVSLAFLWTPYLVANYASQSSPQSEFCFLNR